MEKVIQFHVAERLLYGILHLPAQVHARQGVLMVIGGPQTRVGSHRLYVQIARRLGAAGIAVFRFDYAGMGDSEGDFVGFEHAGASIRAAIDTVYDQLPELEQLIVWSLCDGAAASAIYAPQDRGRIAALILCNPYVPSAAGQARVFLKYYYLRRLLQKEFWLKVGHLRLDLKDTIGSLVKFIGTSRNHRNTEQLPASDRAPLPLPERVMHGLVEFQQPVQFIISSADLTGMEFYQLLKSTPAAKKRERQGVFTVRFVSEADHTFSTPESTNMAIEQTLGALEQLAGRIKLPLPVPTAC